jgi:hypothetical protein
MVLWFALAACKSPVGQPDAATSHWSTGSDVPLPRFEPGVAALGQRVVVVGGFDTAGLDITQQVDVFDTLDPTWSQLPLAPLPPAPVAWTSINLAGIGTTLYLLGGIDAQHVAHGEAYALDTQDAGAMWRPVASMPAGMERGGAAVVITPPRIYLFGGAGTDAAFATNLFYDSLADSWGQLTPDLPAPRAHPAGMRRADGTFVVAGGFATLDTSSPAGDTWQLLTLGTMWMIGMPMPVPRGECAYGGLQAQLICAGGAAGSAVLTTNESYDPLANMWTELEPVPEPRWGTPGAVVGARLFVPGGGRSLVIDPLATLLVYTANL